MRYLTHPCKWYTDLFPLGVLFYTGDTLKQAKLQEREEATQKSLDRIKQRYQEEEASQYLFPSFFLIYWEVE